MLITNFGDHKTALTEYLRHSRWSADYDLATSFFEASINRRLSVRPMETVVNLTTTNGAVTLPPDYMVWRALIFTGATPFDELDYVHPAYLDTTSNVEGGNPKIFTIEASTLKTRPINDTSAIFELHYFGTIPTVTGNDLNTNWLLTEHPDAYLYGTLVELFALQRNVEGATLYKQRRDEVLQEIISEYADGVGATSPLVRSDGYF